MKKYITILCASFFISLNAQTSKSDTLYCLTVIGEEQVLIRAGKKITEDVKLKSGDRLSFEGRIRKIDGAEIKLKEGECVNDNGEVIKPK